MYITIISANAYVIMLTNAVSVIFALYRSLLLANAAFSPSLLNDPAF